jgi:hypothetical protein
MAVGYHVEQAVNDLPKVNRPYGTKKYQTLIFRRSSGAATRTVHG